MSSPPTYEQSQLQSQSQVGDLLATPAPELPPTPPPSGDNISACARVDISQSTASLHSQQPGFGNEIQDQGQDQGNESRPLEKPCYIWAVAAEDSIVSACYGLITRILGEGEEKVHVDPVFGWKPMSGSMDFFTMVVYLRYIVQFSMGLGLLLGLLSSKKRRTIFCLKMWMLGALVIFCEQVLSLARNIMNLSKIHEDEATAWIKVAIVIVNFLDILLRIFTFYLVMKFLKNANSHGSQEQAGQELDSF